MSAAPAARIAALAMYDWPEVQSANYALWAFIAGWLGSAGIEAPASLDRTLRYSEPWFSPNLLLAQTCGYPFVATLRGKVRLVGTACYDVPGCEGADYSSVIITNRGSKIASLADLGNASAAINTEDSQSGHWALRAAIAVAPGAVPPKRAILSGGHRLSLRRVAAGTADVAAIDAVCWALAERHEPLAHAAVRVIARSPSSPGLPLITALGSSDATLAALRSAMAAAVTAPELQMARRAIFLKGFEVLPESAYDRVLELKDRSLAHGFPALEA